VTPTSGDTIILGVFVDDVLIFYSRRDAAQWSELKAKLRQRYRMKDLGAAEWVLGMQLIRDRKQRTIGLSIARYVDKMCSEFRLTDANPMPTPEAPGQQLHKKHDAQNEEERQRMAGVPYRELVGSLLYAQVAARPDIAHAVAMLTRHMQDPGEACWTATKRCLRFLKGTKDRQLIFGGALSQPSSNSTSQSQSNASEVSQLESSERKGISIAHPSRLSELHPLITVWCDADWAGDQDDRRSTSGAILQLFGSSVSWHSKKQSTVALSSAEAEYVSLSAAVTEAMWLSQLLTDIGCPAQLPMQVRCDNQAAIRIAAADGSVSHSRVKHIAVRHHFVRDAAKQGQIEVDWVPTLEQLADVCTKAMDWKQFTKLQQHIMGQQEEVRQVQSVSRQLMSSELKSKQEEARRAQAVGGAVEGGTAPTSRAASKEE
jgi:hypothetical protein